MTMSPDVPSELSDAAGSPSPRPGARAGGATDSIATDSIATDSIATDSIATDQALAAHLARADDELAAGDARRALTTLAMALQVTKAPRSLTPILQRILRAAASTPADAESAIALLKSARERFGDVDDVIAALADVYERAGRAENALMTWNVLVERSEPGARQAHLCEHMGDLAMSVLQQPQQALIHYQAAFRAHHEQRSSIRKAAFIYLEAGREEQAKQLLDLEAEVVADSTDAGTAVEAQVRSELAPVYERIGDTLLLRPTSHDVARDALERAATYGADGTHARELLEQLASFPQTWKEHVRRLRDAALDARDKREAARRYLAIAQLYAAYAPADPQIEQNVDKCMLLAPGYRPALKFLEQLYRDDGRLKDFIDRLTAQAEVMRSVEVAVDLWLYLAVLLAENGANHDELAAIYERVRKLDPRHLAALHALTELYLEASHYDRAVVVMEAFLNEASDPVAKRTTLRQLSRLYEVEIGDLRRATECLEALRDYEEDRDLLVQLADLYQRLGDHGALADVLEALVTRAALLRLPDDEELRILERLHALYEGQLGMPEKAFTAGARLFALAPRLSLEDDLARLAEALGRPAAFATALLEAATRAPHASEARRLRLKAADFVLRSGDRRRARTLIESVLEVDPRDRDALALLDQLVARDAPPEEHAALLEMRLRTATEPAERVPLLVLLADSFARQHKAEMAIETLQDALELDATSRDALVKLEDVLRSEERYVDLPWVLERRLRREQDANDVTEARAVSLRLAKVYDERLDRAEDAAELYLRVHEHDGERDPEVLRALERLLARGVAVLPIAEALQPYYASVEAWRRHVEMLVLRRDAEEGPPRRVALSRAMAAVLEEELESPREALDAWADALLIEPQSAELLAEVERTAEESSAYARLADVIEAAADRLPEGPQKHSLLARRAALLQGVLGDQAAAIQAHRSLLATTPTHLPSLDALCDLYERRDQWRDLREVLEKRLALATIDESAPIAARLGALCLDRFDDAAAARGFLETAVSGTKPVKGEARIAVLHRLIGIHRLAWEERQSAEDANRLAWGLSTLAEELAGPERSAVRAELGEVYRGILKRHEEALAAYEASLANDPRQDVALGGMRALLDACSSVATRATTT